MIPDRGGQARAFTHRCRRISAGRRYGARVLNCGGQRQAVPVCLRAGTYSGRRSMAGCTGCTGWAHSVGAPALCAVLAPRCKRSLSAVRGLRRSSSRQHSITPWSHQGSQTCLLCSLHSPLRAFTGGGAARPLRHPTAARARDAAAAGPGAGRPHLGERASDAVAARRAGGCAAGGAPLEPGGDHGSATAPRAAGPCLHGAKITVSRFIQVRREKHVP